MERIVSVKNGIDPKSIANLVQLCTSFKSEIRLKKDEKTANAKSIMGVMALQIIEPTELTVIAEGEDLNQALDDVSSYLENI